MTALNSAPAADARLGTGITLIKSLRRGDIVFLIIALMVGVDGITVLAQGGGQGVLWTTVLAAVFLVPNAMVFAETAGAFPEEGGIYAWVKRAFGRKAAAVASMLYWITNPIWLGGSLAFIAEGAWSQFVSPIPDGSWGDYLFKFIFIWAAIFVAVVSLRRGKLIINLGVITKLIVLVVLVLTAVVYVVSRGTVQVTGADFAPTVAGFLAIAPITLFALIGFEAPSAASGEMHHAQRDTPIAIARGGVVTVLAYILPVLAIVLVTPAKQLGEAGVMPSIAAAFDVWGPAGRVLVGILAVFFVLGVLTQGSAWMISTDRVQAVAASDGSFFGGFFGRFSDRLGTPVRMNIASGVISTIFFVAAMTLVHGSAASIFVVVLTTAITTLLVSYLIIVPAAIRLRLKHPDIRRPYRVPGGTKGFVILASVVGAFLLLGSWLAIFPGTIEGLLGVDYPFEEIWGVSQLNFETFTVGTLVVVIAIGFTGYAFGGGVRRRLTPETEIAGREPGAAVTVDSE